MELVTDTLETSPATVWKYVQIAVNNLSDATKYPIHDKYITNPIRERLWTIISRFYVRTGLSNICGAIDGIHIPLLHRASTKVTLAHSDYFNRKSATAL